MADWRDDQATDKYGIPTKQTHPTAATGAPGTTGAFVTSDPLGAPGSTGADFTYPELTTIPGGVPPAGAFSPIYDPTDQLPVSTGVTTEGGQQQQLRRPTEEDRGLRDDEKVGERHGERHNAAQYSALRETQNLGQEANIPHLSDSPGSRGRRSSRTSGGGGYGVDQEEDKEKKKDVEMETRPGEEERKQQHQQQQQQWQLGRGDLPKGQGTHQNPTGHHQTHEGATCPREVSGYQSFQAPKTTAGSAPGSTGAFKTSDRLGGPGSTGAAMTAPGTTTNIPGVGDVSTPGGGGVYDPVVGGRTHIGGGTQQQQQQQPQHQQQQQFHQKQPQQQRQFYHPTGAGAAAHNLGQGGGEQNPNQDPNMMTRDYKTGVHSGSIDQPNLEQGAAAARVQVVRTVPGSVPGGGAVVYGRETITTTANLVPGGAAAGHMGGGGGGNATQPGQQEQWERVEKKGLTERAKEIKDRLGGGSK